MKAPTSLKTKLPPTKRVSDRYTLLSTQAVLKQFVLMNWMEVQSSEVKVRLKQYEGFQYHVVRLRHEGVTSAISNMEYSHTPEIIVANSHDGLSSLRIYGGWHLEGPHDRQQSLVVSEQLISLPTLHHKGVSDLAAVVKEAVKLFEAAVPFVSDELLAMRDKTLSDSKIRQFARDAVAERWRYFPRHFEIPVITDVVLDPLIQLPTTNRLWKAFINAHYHLTKGGLKVKTSEGTRNATTRPLTNIKEYIRFSEALWTIARSYL